LLVLVVMMGVAVAEGSGVISTAVRSVVTTVSGRWLTFAIALTGITGSVASDAVIIVLPPLAAMAFLAVAQPPAGDRAGVRERGRRFQRLPVHHRCGAAVRGDQHQRRPARGRGVRRLPAVEHLLHGAVLRVPRRPDHHGDGAVRRPAGGGGCAGRPGRPGRGEGPGSRDASKWGGRRGSGP